MTPDDLVLPSDLVGMLAAGSPSPVRGCTMADIVAVRKVLEQQEAERARLRAQLAMVQAVVARNAEVEAEAYARWEMLGTLLDLADAP